MKKNLNWRKAYYYLTNDSIFDENRVGDYIYRYRFKYENIFIKPSYVDSMYAQIFQTPLGAKKYVYSDLCYYFTQKILEKQINCKQDEYLRKNILALAAETNFTWFKQALYL